MESWLWTLNLKLWLWTNLELEHRKNPFHTVWNMLRVLAGTARQARNACYWFDSLILSIKCKRGWREPFFGYIHRFDACPAWGRVITSGQGTVLKRLIAKWVTVPTLKLIAMNHSSQQNKTKRRGPIRNCAVYLPPITADQLISPLVTQQPTVYLTQRNSPILILGFWLQ